MDTVRVVTLIETTLTRRGKGVEDDPIRIITQWWTPGGELVVERDPYILGEELIPFPVIKESGDE